MTLNVIVVYGNKFYQQVMGGGSDSEAREAILLRAAKLQTPLESEVAQSAVKAIGYTSVFDKVRTMSLVVDVPLSVNYESAVDTIARAVQARTPLSPFRR